MGVRGLSSFFDQNPDLSKPFQLHDSPVILDGNNIIHAIYFNYKLNFMYGGDYKKYADGIRKFMTSFLECNIKPIVIFDGGYEKSDRKLKTVIQRSRNRLTQVQYIAKHGGCSGKVLPIMAYEVFYSVLTELSVAFAQCDYEADDQVTALANHYKCPVISADSDFFIFDIHNGFINLNSVDMTVNLNIDSTGKEYKFLNCNIYYIEEFVSYFPGLDKSALPLFGTLMGNDFVQSSHFDNFFSNIHLPKYKGKKLILNSKQKKMMGLLCWLQHNTLNEAVDQITQYLKKDKREYIKAVIENSVNGYKLNHCNLSLVIDKNVSDFKTELLLNSRLFSPCGNYLPVDFVMEFHQGHFPSFFINVIATHRVFLQPQVENINLLSSYVCSLFIRQIMYGILVRHNTKEDECKSSSCLTFIEEYDRRQNSLQKELVEPIFSLEGVGILPNLIEVSLLESEKCKAIIFEVLGVNSDFFIDIPEKWQLLIGCINYWLHNCEPHGSESFIYALILNIIYFSLIKHKKILNNEPYCEKHSMALKCDCLSVMCVLSNVSELELKYARKNLEKYTKKPPFNHGNPLILEIIHSYSQLQTCILYTIYLNKLLGNCMENPSPELCFSGTMLYNIAKDIVSRSNQNLFVAEILGRDSNLNLLFTELSSKISKNLPDDYNLKGHSLPKKHKKSKRYKDSTNVDLKNINSCNKFEILDLSDEVLL